MSTEWQINKYKIIAILRSIPKEKVADTVQALYEGGIRLMEVTFDQSNPNRRKDTAKCISAICGLLGEKICIGAGTVMTKEQVREAFDAGAKYIISPNTDSEVIAETKRLGAVSIPGALTPSETAAAYNMGADYVKLFPAGVLGIPYIKALRAPISHIPMLAVGGINADNLQDFLETGISGVGVGSNLADLQLIKKNRWKALTELARSFAQEVKKE